MPLPPHKHLNLKVVNCRRDAFFAGASKYRECCRDRSLFEQGDMWGVMTIPNATELHNAFEALINFNINHAPNPFAAVFVFSKNGGNDLGITIEYGLLILSNIANQWTKVNG
ncbi:hypothetical protein SS1G_07209 [Sclerotinia sclerotiorum 1980 UF-70]|uniref:Uncharacterized protein n=1 Tax=Sclerotinia sclerotiorum (strain ATCC 18683 / 1980 / Ss-1) TaxID=665079 RepID=A7EPG0_SCLS1|nr:hypothetical protein SS1G_07209 [Sclerotinia sclerotiorum 1980 UF-70]EDO04726.1 hypothetical protein SS1G_07209 [Sclerotinia sclerotiorum 1980 UF-70]